MRLNKIGIAMAVAAGFSISTSHAGMEDQEPKKVKFEIGAGILGGGDELASINFDDGSDDTVNAGSGVTLYAGIIAPITSEWSGQVRLGWLNDSISGEDGFGEVLEFSFSRLPLDLMARYEHNKHSLSAGLTYHMSPEFEASYDDESVTVDFESATGFVAEYHYTFKPNRFYVGLKYQSITYTLKDFDINESDFDGTGFGLLVGAIF